MITKQKEIYEILKQNNIAVDDDYIVFPNTEVINNLLSKHGINFDNNWNNDLTVSVEEIPFKIYNSFCDYLYLDNVEESSNILILNYPSKPYSLIDSVTYVDFEIVNENYSFSNAIAYSDLITFIREQDKDTNEPFHFVDYVNTTTRRMVFTSLSDKGRLIIRYYREIYEFDENTNLSLAVHEFKRCFDLDVLQLPKFLKAAIIDVGSRFEEKDRIYKVLENLTEIVNKAKVNFEIYINGLSIDKIKKEYDDYKVKYFKEVSDILSNLTTKVVSFPVLTASTLFAVEKLKDYPFFIALLIITTFIINVYLIILLVVNFKDLSYISSTVENDYNSLIENNFFIKYPEEKSVFSRIKQRIVSRIEYLKYMCEAYYWIMGVSNGAIIYLMLTYLNTSKSILCLYSLSILLVLAMARNKIRDIADKDRL